MVRRGDVFYANLSPVVGSEQGGTRPVVIVQNDKGNRYSKTVIVAPVSSADGRRLHIVRGDNLWNIARAHYGAGWRHTVIFDANKEQIVDPNLIYPGQILTLPKVN